MSKHTTLDASEYSEEELNVIVPTPSTSKKSRSSSTAGASASRKRKCPLITPVTPSKYSKYELFGSDSEDEDGDDQVEVGSTKHDRSSKSKNMKTSKTSHRSSPDSELKKKKSSSHSHASEPLPTNADALSRRTAASDVFGSDSDDEATYDLPKTGNWVPHGVLRQSNLEKEGSHYIEVKVYKCDDIKNIQPMNRWRHAIITIKNKSDVGSEAWEHLTNFIKATRQEFKDCRPEIISGYS